MQRHYLQKIASRHTTKSGDFLFRVISYIEYSDHAFDIRVLMVTDVCMEFDVGSSQTILADCRQFSLLILSEFKQIN